jgi:hypothetical protein
MRDAHTATLGNLILSSLLKAKNACGTSTACTVIKFFSWFSGKSLHVLLPGSHKEMSSILADQ